MLRPSGAILTVHAGYQEQIEQLPYRAPDHCHSAENSDHLHRRQDADGGNQPAADPQPGLKQGGLGRAEIESMRRQCAEEKPQDVCQHHAALRAIGGVGELPRRIGQTAGHDIRTRPLRREKCRAPLRQFIINRRHRHRVRRNTGTPEASPLCRLLSQHQSLASKSRGHIDAPSTVPDACFIGQL